MKTFPQSQFCYLQRVRDRADGPDTAEQYGGCWGTHSVENAGMAPVPNATAVAAEKRKDLDFPRSRPLTDRQTTDVFKSADAVRKGSRNTTYLASPLARGPIGLRDQPVVSASTSIWGHDNPIMHKHLWLYRVDTAPDHVVLYCCNNIAREGEESWVPGNVTNAKR